MLQAATAEFSKPTTILIKGGRAAWVVRAALAFAMATLLLLTSLAGLSEGRSELMALLPIGAALLVAAVVEMGKALKPSRLTADAEGITLRDAFTCRRWTWDRYLRAVSNRAAITRYRFFVIRVNTESGRARRVSIGPWPADLAETLRNFAASVGRDVPLLPPLYT